MNNDNEYKFTKEYAQNVLKGLGGKKNITILDNCITRLRVTLKDTSLVDEELLIKKTGAKRVIKEEQNSIHVVYGIKIDAIREAINREMLTEDSDDKSTNSQKILKGIGNKENIVEIANCITRLRLVLKDANLVDEEFLMKETGAAKVIKDGNNVHIVYGLKIEEIRTAIEKELNS